MVLQICTICILNTYNNDDDNDDDDKLWRIKTISKTNKFNNNNYIAVVDKQI